MKHPLSALIVVAVFAAGGARAAPTVVPIYPGAVMDAHAGDVTVQVYLSQDPLKKVAAWYAAKVGSLTAAAGNTLWNADGLNSDTGRPLGATDPQVEAHRIGRVTMDQSAVVRSLKDMTMTKGVGVLCEGLQFLPVQNPSAESTPASSGAAAPNRTLQQMGQMQQQLLQVNRKLVGSTSPQDRAIARMSDLFEGLKYEAMSGQHGHTKQQLLAVYARYKHLETDWYPTVKTADGVTSYDRWLLARQRAELSTPIAHGGQSMDVSALAARVQAAAAAGDTRQLQALSHQMQAAMQAQQGTGSGTTGSILKDRWDFWLAFLKKLDAHAYRTRIRINTLPKTWGY